MDRSCFKSAGIGATAWMALATSLCIASEHNANDAGTLSGLWGTSRVFAPAGTTRVMLWSDGDRLAARARGEVTHVPQPKDDRVAFTFPHGVGGFRGRLQAGGRAISGHWISEPGTLAFSPYATPMTLHRVGAGEWIGNVEPILQQFSITIAIQPDSDGEMRAFLRNPERNQGRYTRLHSVHRNGNAVTFKNADGEDVLSGMLNDDDSTLSVSMPWRGGTYDLSRVGRATASGYFPRRNTLDYEYATPLGQDDGWAVDHAKMAGMNAARLQQFVQSIIDTQTTSIRTPYIHSLLVARHGKLVLEEYFYGHFADKVHDLRSATKSITGIMAGQAIAQVDGLDLTTPVYPVFADDAKPTDTRRQRLNVEHLLTMSSGFHCDDNDEATPGNEDRMQEQTDQQDWWQYTLDLPMINEPGSHAAYCSAGVNLMGGVISRTTGVWLPEYFHTRLAQPLQIRYYHMNLDPLKRGYGGGGIHMRPRDFFKFAQLMLSDGKWNGRRVVPQFWVSQSLRGHTSIYSEGDYGYNWWVQRLPYRDRTVEVFSATGNGGQMLILVPELELAVGFTGGNYGDFRTWSAWRDTLVPEYVFDAISD